MQLPVKDDTITWASVNNIVPLIGSAIMVASSFFMLQTRLSLIEQKVEYIAKSQEEMLTLFKSVEQRYGEMALKVNTLENRCCQ